MIYGAVCWNVWGAEWSVELTADNTAGFILWHYGEA